MANWCNNTIVFEGNPKAIEKVQQLFYAMAKQEQDEGCGQLPYFVSNTNGGYFFGIYEYETELVHYQTKWLPNTEILQKIAEYYNVNFTQDYEELGCLVYGRATFSDKILTDIHLEDEDFDKYQFDEETNIYHFEGEEYDSDSEILETLLERKIENHFNNTKNQQDENIR